MALEPGERRGLGTANAPDVAVVSAAGLLEQFDAVVLAGGATLPRDLPVPGRGLRGVHGAMEYLKPSNLVREGAWAESPITRRRASTSSSSAAVTPAPTAWAPPTVRGRPRCTSSRSCPGRPDARPDDNPWPTWPLIYRTSSAHEEGGERVYAVTTTEFVDDGIGGVRSNHWLCHMVLPEMVDRKDGAIIIVSSIGGLRGSSVLGTYAISKAADFQLARNLAVEYGPSNIRVNCIAPGLIKTDFARALWDTPEAEKRTSQGTPLRRLGVPDDIAGAAVFLASRAGAYMTGQGMVIDGGNLA